MVRAVDLQWFIPYDSGMARALDPKQFIPADSGMARALDPKQSIPADSGMVRAVDPKQFIPADSGMARAVDPKQFIPADSGMARALDPKQSLQPKAVHDHIIVKATLSRRHLLQQADRAGENDGPSDLCVTQGSRCAVYETSCLRGQMEMVTLLAPISSFSIKKKFCLEDFFTADKIQSP